MSRLYPPTETGGAVLTGSQVYGTPTEASDVDLVVLCDESTQIELAKLLTGEEPLHPSSGPRGGISVKAGRLNLILTTEPDEVERWRKGTRDLIERKPVTRDDAVLHLRDVVGDGEPLDPIVRRAEKNGG